MARPNISLTSPSSTSLFCKRQNTMTTTGPSNPSSMNHEETDLQLDWTAERLCRASFKDLGTPSQVEHRFVRHLLTSESCKASLVTLLTSQSSTTRDYSLEINVFQLLQSDLVLGCLLLRFPATLLPLLEKAIVQAQQHLLLSSSSSSQQDTTIQGTVKGSNHHNQDSSVMMTRVHARLVHLPPTCCITSLAAVEASDVGKIVQLTGTVVRASPVQMYESARTYQCTGKNMAADEPFASMPIWNNSTMPSSLRNPVHFSTKIIIIMNDAREPNSRQSDRCIPITKKSKFKKRHLGLAWDAFLVRS